MFLFDKCCAAVGGGGVEQSTSFSLPTPTSVVRSSVLRCGEESSPCGGLNTNRHSSSKRHRARDRSRSSTSSLDNSAADQEAAAFNDQPFSSTGLCSFGDSTRYSSRRGSSGRSKGGRSSSTSRQHRNRSSNSVATGSESSSGSSSTPKCKSFNCRLSEGVKVIGRDQKLREDSEQELQQQEQAKSSRQRPALTVITDFSSSFGETNSSCTLTTSNTNKQNFPTPSRERQSPPSSPEEEGGSDEFCSPRQEEFPHFATASSGSEFDQLDYGLFDVIQLDLSLGRITEVSLETTAAYSTSSSSFSPIAQSASASSSWSNSVKQANSKVSASASYLSSILDQHSSVLEKQEEVQNQEEDTQLSLSQDQSAASSSGSESIFPLEKLSSLEKMPSPSLDDDDGIDPSIKSVASHIQEIDSEFQRMTQDADAILDSIRRENLDDDDKQKGKSKSKKTPASKKSPTKKKNKSKDSDDDDNSDYDDDISDEMGRLDSVSEEIRKMEQELKSGGSSSTKSKTSKKKQARTPTITDDEADDMADYEINNDDILAEMERVGAMKDKLSSLSSSSPSKSLSTPSPGDRKVKGSKTGKYPERVKGQEDEDENLDSPGIFASCIQSERVEMQTRLPSPGAVVAGSNSNALILAEKASIDMVNELRAMTKSSGTAMVQYTPPPPGRGIRPREIGPYEEGVDMYLLASFGTIWAVIVVLMDHVRHLLDEDGTILPPFPFN